MKNRKFGKTQFAAKTASPALLFKGPLDLQRVFAARNLSQAKPASKQLNLNKLGDADGSQIHWLSDAAKNRSFMLFVY
ncbi:MAG: hypothetical protein KF898_03440 [Parachlamydiales bacterium]|nr:hypothetical protein [Verrucomicrobiota bacterium]MBX3718684.1 hypothetical protein [Candidatus Acheromyda pituitae]